MSENIPALAAILVRKTPDTGKIEVGIFQRTARRTFHPNLREFMGGEFQAEETPEEVLRRELREKTRMNPAAIENIGALDIQEEKITMRRHIFLCTFLFDAVPHLDPSKHQSFSWVSTNEVKEMTDLVPGTLEILEATGLE